MHAGEQQVRQRTVEGAGVPLAVTERGSGRAVLLVHGMAADASAWDLEALPGRAIAFDRRGYGGSGAPEPYGATTVQEQAEDAVAVLRACEAVPAVLVGEDLGALVCLDALTRHPALVAGAVLIDPPVLAFVPEAAEALGAQRAALEKALREGGPERAVASWLGPSAEAERVRRAGASARAFFADFGALATWPVTRALLRSVAVPVAVVVTAAAPVHVRAAAERVVDLLPGGRREPDLAGALRAIAGA